MKETIEAAYEGDFQEILERLGLVSDLALGNLACAFCRRKLDASIVVAVFSDGKDILLCCDNSECGAKLGEKAPAAV